MKHRIWLLSFLLCVFVLGGSLTAGAVPAAPQVSKVTQPDGVVVEVVQQGDEWSNSVETRAGYAVAKARDGFWYYVQQYDGKTPVLESIRADREVPYGLRRHARPAVSLAPSSAPQGASPLEALAAAPVGTFNGKVLFILVRFSDTRGTYTEKTFGAMVGSSVANYYSKASYGRVTLSPAEESFGIINNGVVGWLNLGYPHPNTGSTTDTRNQKIARDAILAANPYVNFSQFDTNRDGYVDSNELAIVVVAAGYERAYSAKYSPSVWGHSWSISSAAGGAPVVDGVTVGSYHGGAGGYAEFGEIHQNSTTDRHKATVGIMVHELGHLIFRLPDLYDTDNTSSGVGAFCVMGAGSWGKASTNLYAGMMPVLPCAWVKYFCQWASGAQVPSGVKSIPAAGALAATSANSVYRASTSASNEYFLVENRRPVGYDRGLEYFLGTGFGGVAIWHIDESMATNAQDAHRMVDLEEADGTQMGTGSGQKTDLWYVGNHTIFDNTSNPNSRMYSGASSGVSINVESIPAGYMSVLFGP